jgi:hypothetical protein
VPGSVVQDDWDFPERTWDGCGLDINNAPVTDDDLIIAILATMPSSPQEGCLFEAGDRENGMFIGIANNAVGGLAFRVAAGYGTKKGGKVLYVSDHDTAVISIDLPNSTIPLDGGVHEVALLIQTSIAAIRLYIDGRFVASAACPGSTNGEPRFHNGQPYRGGGAGLGKVYKKEGDQGKVVDGGSKDQWPGDSCASARIWRWDASMSIQPIQEPERDFCYFALGPPPVDSCTLHGRCTQNGDGSWAASEGGQCSHADGWSVYRFVLDGLPTVSRMGHEWIKVAEWPGNSRLHLQAGKNGNKLFADDEINYIRGEGSGKLWLNCGVEDAFINDRTMDFAASTNASGLKLRNCSASPDGTFATGQGLQLEGPVALDCWSNQGIVYGAANHTGCRTVAAGSGLPGALYIEAPDASIMGKRLLAGTLTPLPPFALAGSGACQNPSGDWDMPRGYWTNNLATTRAECEALCGPWCQGYHFSAGVRNCMVFVAVGAEDPGAAPFSLLDASPMLGKAVAEEPSCEDKIQNQDEDDVDCGGPCTACCPASEPRLCDGSFFMCCRSLNRNKKTRELATSQLCHEVENDCASVVWEYEGQTKVCGWIPAPSEHICGSCDGWPKHIVTECRHPATPYPSPEPTQSPTPAPVSPTPAPTSTPPPTARNFGGLNCPGPHPAGPCAGPIVPITGTTGTGDHECYVRFHRSITQNGVCRGLAEHGQGGHCDCSAEAESAIFNADTCYALAANVSLGGPVAAVEYTAGPNASKTCMLYQLAGEAPTACPSGCTAVAGTTQTEYEGVAGEGIFSGRLCMLPGSAVAWVGCYKDSARRSLDVLIGGQNGTFNVATCEAACVARGDYIYFALQDGGQCFCSNSLGPAPELLPDSECLAPFACCAADESCYAPKACGKYFTNAVYYVGGTVPAQAWPTPAPTPGPTWGYGIQTMHGSCRDTSTPEYTDPPYGGSCEYRMREPSTDLEDLKRACVALMEESPGFAAVEFQLVESPGNCRVFSRSLSAPCKTCRGRSLAGAVAVHIV